jgi:hypothetical protein
MNPILQAIASGYGVNKILKYLAQSNPGLASKITSAVSYGYTANEILKYVMKGGSSASSSLPKASKMDMNLYEKMQYSLPEDIENVAQMGLGLGAAGLGYFAGQLGVQGTNNQQPNAPVPGQPMNQPIQTTEAPSPGAPINPPPQASQSPGQIATPQIPMPQGITPGQQIQQGVQQPLQSAMQPQGAEEIAQAAQAMPQEQQQPQSLFEQLTGKLDPNTLSKSQMQQLKFLNTVADQLQSKGKTINDPEVKKLAVNISKTLQGNSGMLMEEVSRGMGRETPKTVPVKDSIVSTPQGVGEVKGISNGKALVEIDGKTIKINQEEIEPPIFSDDDVADAYDRIMSVIPEEHRSGFIQWAGYDEDRNALGFIPRGGKYEEIMNITPEEATMIKEGKGFARTTGENREGLWVAGEDTRGGIISQIIWDRKKAKKAEEDKQMTFGFTLSKPEKKDRGMKPLFDEMGYARSKSQEREKAIKLAEKERKKKEKDEAKKRKK